MAIYDPDTGKLVKTPPPAPKKTPSTPKTASTPKKKSESTPVVNQPAGPFFQTQTGLEVPRPGKSVGPIQTASDIQYSSAEDMTPQPAPPTPVADTVPPTTPATPPTTPAKTVVSTFTDDKGQQVAVYNDGTTTVVGQTVNITERKSAFDILEQEFARYGLDSLVGDTIALAQSSVGPAEFSLQLRQLKPYKDRFFANEARIKNGLTPLSEAQYLALEDQYQNIFREYGLPKSFYATTTGGRQTELEKFIEGDISPTELESRVQLAVERVKNAPPEVLTTLSQYYPGVTQDSLVAYVLDPQKALSDIKRQVQVAEVGGMASRFGLAATRARAEELTAAGVTREVAQKGFQDIAEGLPRGQQLAKIYGETPYDQTAAEQEVFGLEGAASAKRKRRKLAGLEAAQFGGQTGLTGGALDTGRAGAY